MSKHLTSPIATTDFIRIGRAIFSPFPLPIRYWLQKSVHPLLALLPKIRIMLAYEKAAD